jgi:hypothetical protein
MLKKTLIASVLGIAALAFAGVAEAQQRRGGARGGAAAGGAATAEGYQRVKSYDFSGDNIDGELVRPDGEFLDARRAADHTSLIRVRQDFIREIVKSAEDL